MAIKYANKRRQFGSPDSDEEELLLDYGMHQRRLLPLLAKTYALHFTQEILLTELHNVLSTTTAPDRQRRALESRAAGTKALGTWHGSRTIQECREACGGAGYLMANRLGALRADTDVFTTFEGDNHILLQLVAKGLLTDYSSSFGDLDQLGMVRFVAGLAVETVLERTSAHKLLERIKDVLPGGSDDSWDQEAGLLDPEYQLAMFRWREEHILSGVARRLKRGMDQGMDTVEVFSRVQDHVIAAGRAHVERLVLEAFVEKNAAMVDSDNKVALNILCDLYALSTIEADRGWFMEHGRLSSARSKAISREVSSLCRQLRPIAEDLVDGFGIPPEMLHAEMLQESGSRPERSERQLMLERLRLPGLGGWGDDPLWATFYDWTVEHPAGRRAAVEGRDRQRPAPALRRSSGDRSAAGGLLGARRAVRWRGRAARAAARPGGPVRRRGHLQAMLDRTMAAARRAPRRRPGRAGARRRRRRCRSRTASSTWSSPSPACTASPTRTWRCARWRRVLHPGGVLTGARCSTTPACATCRSARSAGSPACSVRRPPAPGRTRLADRGRLRGHLPRRSPGAIGYFRGDVGADPGPGLTAWPAQLPHRCVRGSSRAKPAQVRTTRVGSPAEGSPMSIATTRADPPDPPRDPLVLALVALVVTDLVGGLLAVAAEVNTWGEAWGSEALLAAPLPMIVAQVVLTVLAVAAHGFGRRVPAGLLALACLVSVVSGFFDGGLGNDALTPALSAYQVFLLAVTGVVGVLAARRAARSCADAGQFSGLRPVSGVASSWTSTSSGCSLSALEGRAAPRPRPRRGRPSWRPRRTCRARGPCRPRRSAGSPAGRTRRRG